jgi:hypothetical protein
VVREADDLAFPEHAHHGVFNRKPALLVDHDQRVFQGPAGRVGLGPPGQGLGNWIHAADAALIIGCDDAVADAAERHVQALGRLLCQAPFDAETARAGEE